MSATPPRFPRDAGPSTFVDAYSSWVHPLKVEHANCYWRFAVDGDAAAHARVQEIEELLADLHSDDLAFEALAAWRDQPSGDALVDRQVHILYPEYRQGHANPELRKKIIRLSLKIEQTCSMFRPELDGKRVDSNELDRRLLREGDDATRRTIWETTRQIGRRTADQVIHLAELRNEMAGELGFDNFYSLALDEEEMDQQQLFAILDALRAQTDEPWRQQKQAIDEEMAALRGKEPSKLQPWDYPERFLQSMPRGNVDSSTDRWFPLPAIQSNAKDFYRGIGLPIDSLWAASDMLPRDGKYPHAFCIGIDNPDDVRVLCNLDSTSRWMETTLHEFGHALYDAGVDRELPWLLRSASHTFITEAVAMFFGRLAGDQSWLSEVAGVPEERAARASQRLREAQLVFVRWALVVSYFERSFYADPHADLDALWWRLVEELQGLRRPAGWAGGDWASKVHIACFPAYYQNYILGELLASQFAANIDSSLSSEWIGNPGLGEFFARLFGSGRSLPWPETIVAQCGEGLSPGYWIKQFGGQA